MPKFRQEPGIFLLYLGEGIGVARNSKGYVFVYTRGGDTSHLYEFDPKGTFVREIGKGL